MTGAEFEGVDIDLLADYVGGALDGTPDEERVAALVAEDPAWQAAFETLAPAMTAVGAALRELEPTPMPDDLAARLDGLLRGPGDGLQRGPGDRLQDGPADGLQRGPGDGLQAGAGEGEPSSGDPASPVPAKVVDLGKARRARRWVAPLTAAAAVLAFAGFGVNALFLSDSSKNTEAAGSADTAAAPMATMPQVGEILRSGADYTDATLGEQRAGTFGADGSAETQASSAGKLDALARLDDPTALAVCLDAITRENAGGPITVEFVDYARFEGRPALIVRFSATNGTRVWVAGPDCGTPATDPDTVRKLPVR